LPAHLFMAIPFLHSFPPYPICRFFPFPLIPPDPVTFCPPASPPRYAYFAACVLYLRLRHLLTFSVAYYFRLFPFRPLQSLLSSVTCLVVGFLSLFWSTPFFLCLFLCYRTPRGTDCPCPRLSTPPVPFPRFTLFAFPPSMRILK